MKKILLAYGALVLVVVALAFFKFNGATFFSGLGTGSSVSINGQKFEVEVANNDTSRQVGLSGRKSLDQKKGMIFLFEKKDKYSFWMKNTLIPLDIIFIDDDKIVHIAKNAIPEKDVKGTLPIYKTPVNANKVLEINGGLSEKNKFKNGDKVTFTNVR